jgi:hypothetical protein
MPAMQRNDKKKILALSLDFDDSYCYIQHGKIANHARLHQAVLQFIKQNSYDEVVLLVGSARQSRDVDVYGHALRQNGSITQALSTLLDFLKNKTDVPVSINEWLLEDVVMGLPQPQQFKKHKTFVESTIAPNSLTPTLPRHLSSKNCGEKEASKQFNVEHFKTSILLFQTHLLNKIDPTSKISFLFVDNLANEIYHNFSCITSCDTLIPNNIQLGFITYFTGDAPYAIKNKTIHGTANNFLEDIKKEIMTQVTQYNSNGVCMLNETKIVACIHAAKKLQARQHSGFTMFNASSSSSSGANNEWEVCMKFNDTESSELDVSIQPKR